MQLILFVAAVALGLVIGGGLIQFSEAPTWLSVALGCVPMVWLLVFLRLAPGIRI